MPIMLLPKVVRMFFFGKSIIATFQTNFLLAMMYGLTMSLKNEIVKIAPKGRVNCIGPGWVRTVRVFPPSPTTIVF